MSSPIKKELERIRDCSAGEHWLPDPQDALIAIIRGIPALQFWDSEFEKPELTEADLPSVESAYRLVSQSPLSDVCKQIVCGAALVFIRKVSSDAELTINKLKAETGYDPATSFSIFDGLE
jgi:hypothetical protein